MTDISAFVSEQHQHVLNRDYAALSTPSEQPYPVEDIEVIQKLQLDKENLV
jgi:hypothetical protein